MPQSRITATTDLNITRLDKHRNGSLRTWHAITVYTQTVPVHTHKVMLPLEVLSGCLTSGRSVGDFGQSLVSLTDGRTPLYADGRCLAGSRQLLQHRRWSTHWRSASGRWLWWYLPHRQVTKHPVWPAGIVTRTQEVTGSHHNLTWRQIKYSQTSLSG